jgi:TRAP-type C4-dicarboxylate transport system substrate-binding protein
MKLASSATKAIVGLAAAALVLTGCASATETPAETTSPAAGGETSTEIPGENITLTIGAGHPAGGAITYANRLESWFVPELKARVAAETNHTLEVIEGYGGSIATLGEVLGATQSGLLDVGAIIYPFEPSNLLLHNLEMKIPFSSPDPEIAIKAMRAVYDEIPYMGQVLEDDFNQRVLGLWTTGSYHLVTTFEWSNFEDLAGRTLTAAGPNLPWITAAGVNPVQGSLGEWYTGLETGVIDGAVMFPEATAGFKLYEPAPFYTEIGFGASPQGAITVNLDTFNALPADVQQILVELGAEFEAQIAGWVKEEGEAGYATMLAAGTTIKSLPLQQRADWANRLADLPNQSAQEANALGLPGSEAYRVYIRAQQDLGYVFPREWVIED